MYSDAATRFPELYAYRYDESELHALFFHLENDPRITRVGRFLRKTSIDELPNLWNVLRGDISLVGPRPEIPQMLLYYGDAASEVLSVQPGVTSLAKVSGRDQLSFAQTLELDLEYVRRRSFLLDLEILARTVVTVLKREGAS
jgi:lipopolysaccharide/colanic/teichoic acid biosynthesis glycosyltransferase